MCRKLLALAGIVSVLGLMSSLAPAQDAPPVAGRWPVEVNTDRGVVTIFQPQLEDFQGDQLSGRLAVSVQGPGTAQPVFGAAWVTSRVAIDRVARSVQILDVNVTRTRFPNVDGATEQALEGAIKQVFTSRPLSLSLDQLLAMLAVVHKEADNAQLQSAPPRIIFLDHPAVKVQYDGAPKMITVENTGLMRVINTPFFVALKPGNRTYYLKGAGKWFSAADPMGPFYEGQAIPGDIAKLADDSGYQDPQQPINTPSAALPGSVEIVTATEPTELIWTDGPAQMGTIPGTDLLYISNSSSDVFQTIDTQQLFVLLSGRWYTAPSHNGPWTFVPPDRLPADFSRIPPNSDKGDVLAHIAGTQAAADAVADSYIPQTAAVDLHQFEQPPVEYDGDPAFIPVEGTNFYYARNTDAAVLRLNDEYYCCYNAVWYRSHLPRGAWEIAVKVPAEIYTIPPSCPDYSVTFCHVYGYTADICYVGYLPGYTGCYAWNGVVVYGTGWHYQPWIGTRYFPRPWTFGFDARYNAYLGHWGFDFAIAFGGGRGWIGRSEGHYIRSGGEWFGFGGFRPVYAHDAAHVTAMQRELAIDASRRDAVIRSVYDNHRTDIRHEPGVRDIVRPEPGRPVVIAGPARNDVFADHNGDVFRKTVDGWENRKGDDWQPARVDMHPGGGWLRPSSQAPRGPDFSDLNRDYKARVSGDQRERATEPPPRVEAPAPREDRHDDAPHDAPPRDDSRNGGGRGR